MRRFVLATALLPVVALAACGSDSGTGSNSGSGSSASASTPPVTLSGATNDHGNKDISGSGASAEVEVELDNFYFGPTFIKAAPGSTVKVELENEGSVAHTFTVDGGVDRTLQPDTKAEVTVKVTSSPLVFYCKFHRGQGMQGAFYTKSGGSGGGSSSSDPDY